MDGWHLLLAVLVPASYLTGMARGRMKGTWGAGYRIGYQTAAKELGKGRGIKEMG